jgi:glycosyltransferase involved in cell wall biosynthesis
MATVLYLYANKSSFVQVDLNLLKEQHTVIERLVTKNSVFDVIQLYKDVEIADLVVGWFASWHSLPSFLLGYIRQKPCLLFTSGYDIANEPDINYGLRQGGIPKFTSSWVFRATSQAIVPSQFSYQEALNNTPLDNQQIRIVPHAVEDRAYFQRPVTKRPIAITVGAVHASSLYRKGIRYFMDTAKLLPDIEFYVVGGIKPTLLAELKAQVSDNVTFTGFMPDEDLWTLMTEAKVYVQASHHEGFGVSVAEAMLARCIPVVSRRGALPEVVAETGIYLDSFLTEEIARKIQIGLDTDDAIGENARQSVLKRFTMEQRRAGIRQVIESMLP